VRGIVLAAKQAQTWDRRIKTLLRDIKPGMEVLYSESVLLFYCIRGSVNAKAVRKPCGRRAEDDLNSRFSSDLFRDV
jgi:hypothetical protein